MSKVNPKISIILVHFGKKKILTDCIRSIHSSKPKTSYEIIIVDNNTINRGYGSGNNLGVERANGDYVFILNPDTLIQKDTIDKLYKFILNNKNVGVVAPTLIDKNGDRYPLQGTKKLTPIRGIFALSFLNKLFPNNPISKEYWLLDVDKTKPFQADAVPGAAFIIKRSLFNKVGGFDKNFFLYFEESDFCNRIKELGYKLYILPNAKVIHFWALSTPKGEAINKIFTNSRFYYFRKNFGLLNAIIVEFFARINKWNVSLLIILILGTFLRFYKLQVNLIFNGELGYDYTTIRGYIDAHRIPLIGPRTSHEWFYIGPIFYWIFAILLPLFNYSALVGVYFFAIVGVVSIYCIYHYLSKLFGKSVGLISAFLLSFSPLWIMLTHDARYNALTAIIFIPFYYYLVKSLENKGKSLFVVGLLLGIMFSFFPSPILLVPGALAVLYIYRKLIDKKYLLSGLTGIIIPNITYIYYNFTHNFEILTNLFSWIPYRILGFIGLYPKNTVTPNILKDNLLGLYTFFQQSYFFESNLLISILILSTIIYSFYQFNKNRDIKVLLILFIVSYLGLFLHGSPPQHYYLVIFPIPIILLSLLLTEIGKKYLWISILILTALLIPNLKYYFSEKWFYINSTQVSTDLYYVPYSLQLKVSDWIANDSHGREFSLARVGKNDYFENNFSLNYQYLLRIKGANLNNNSKLRYTIYEDTSHLPKKEKIIWIENLAIIKNETY